MADQSFIELAKDYGPAVLSVIASFMSALFSVGLWLAQTAWKKHKRQMSALQKSIEEIAKKHAETVETSRKDHAKLWEMTATLRAELQLSNQKTETLKGGILGLEGAINTQQKSLNLYIEKMGQVDGKLAAIFRFLDAPRRATDV